MGQISKTFSNNRNIIEDIVYKYEKLTNVGFINTVEGLTKLKVEIDSPPYSIIERNGQLIAINEEENIKPVNSDTITAGYVIVINGIEFLIRSSAERILNENNEIQIIHNGFFELNDENFLIKNVSFKYPVNANIDYVVSLN